MYSIALGPRFFKWKMLSLSGPNALLFLQLLIALVTMSAVKVSAMLSTHCVVVYPQCPPSPLVSSWSPSLPIWFLLK